MAQTVFGFTECTPSPVISLSIFDHELKNGEVISPQTNILTVVRDRETNYTHPNVVSVPTQRIPLSLLQTVIANATVEKEEDSLTYYSFSFSDNAKINGHDPIIYIVESLLARKLGLAEPLERNEFTFNACLRVEKIGKSYHPNLPVDDGQVEYITMLNFVVFIKSGLEFIPHSTSSYSHILWTEAGNFMKTVKEANPLFLDSSLDPIDYCVHGLCVSSTYSVLAHELGIDPNLQYFI
jgi:hypothetical protein